MFLQSMEVFALRYLHQVTDQDIRNWAAFLIEEGYQSESLKILADLSPGTFEVDYYFFKTLQELNWEIPDETVCLYWYIRLTAQRIVCGEINPVAAAQKIYQASAKLGFPEVFSQWIYLAKGQDPTTYRKISGQTLGNRIVGTARKMFLPKHYGSSTDTRYMSKQELFHSAGKYLLFGINVLIAFFGLSYFFRDQMNANGVLLFVTFLLGFSVMVAFGGCLYLWVKGLLRSKNYRFPDASIRLKISAAAEHEIRNCAELREIFINPTDLKKFLGYKILYYKIRFESIYTMVISLFYVGVMGIQWEKFYVGLVLGLLAVLLCAISWSNFQKPCYSRVFAEVILIFSLGISVLFFSNLVGQFTNYIGITIWTIYWGIRRIGFNQKLKRITISSVLEESMNQVDGYVRKMMKRSGDGNLIPFRIASRFKQIRWTAKRFGEVVLFVENHGLKIYLIHRNELDLLRIGRTVTGSLKADLMIDHRTINIRIASVDFDELVGWKASDQVQQTLAIS